jgi:uncharacterized protein (DUF697 family)
MGWTASRPLLPKEKAVYWKLSRRQVVRLLFCRVPGNTPFAEFLHVLATLELPGGSNRLRIILGMAGLHQSANRSSGGRIFGRFLRFGLLRGLRSIEINPEVFRRELAEKHGVWVADFARMKDLPLERLDAIATTLIRDSARLAVVEGAGFGLGGMITFLPDAGLLTVITLRLIQRLSLLYGFESRGPDARLEMWKAAAAAAGIDYGKDLVEKEMFEKIAPRIVERLAVKLGQETAEKWAGRLIPFASSAIGGAVNFSFVRGWGRRVQRSLRARHPGASTTASPAAASCHAHPVRLV